MSGHIQIHNGLMPSEPLWKRAPSRDHNGRSYSDMMLIIPRLNKRSEDELQLRLTAISTALERYQHVIVFADLNLKINVLWISFHAIPGLTYEIAATVKMHVPEAVLVADQPR